MKETYKVIGIYLALCFFVGCATTPPAEPKFYINQAVWNNTTKDKAYSACLSAMTIERFAVHPLGTKKESGLIVSNPREFYYKEDKDFTCYYTLQILVAETQDGKVMINVNAVDTGYRYKGYGLPEDTVKRYMSDIIADHIDKFFGQIDLLLGKAEHYKKDKPLF